jgi:serine/threonine protein kinase/Tol biopolymer transport system component
VALSAGTRLGPYEIIAAIGAGGMGEVYKACDTRLDRAVAIKILSETLAADPQFRERFDREARTISKLDHPHICALHDVGEHEATAYLVMQYLEGETLAQRLERGAVPCRDALAIAIQIADALDRAHRAGIVHRDLKPGNVMLTKSGAKLLDFGLAKTRAPAGSGGASMLPTTPALTAAGVILGTFQYMSPEQLEGKETDARSDIFAFGAVLYEMVIGCKAFDADSAPRVMTAILTVHPPPISTLQPAAPPALERVITRCLAKDPDERWQSAYDLKAELQWIAEGVAQPGGPIAFPKSDAGMRERLAWVTAAVGILTAAILAVLNFSTTREPPRLLKLSVPRPPIAESYVVTALSPDGHSIVYAAGVDVHSHQLWIRRFDSVAMRALPGTEGATFPFWSPDSRFVGFFANGKLKTIEIGTSSEYGRPHTLCDAPFGRGGAWNRDGVIIFSPNLEEAIYRIPAAGGQVSPVTTLKRERRQTSHRWPDFLPDGRHFLYWARSDDEQNQGIYVGSLDARPDSQGDRRLLGTPSNALYAGPGYVLFERDRTLMAQAFDVRRLQLLGEPQRIASEVSNPLTNHVNLSVSSTGLLAYHSGDATRQLVWFDRTGSPVGSIRDSEDADDPQLSPDETHVLFTRTDPQNRAGDIWLVELRRGTASRLTSQPSFEWRPIWSPDGHQILFASNRNGPMNLYQLPVSGGEDKVLLQSSKRLTPTDWSRDGRLIVYGEVDAKTQEDLWILPLDGGRKPFPFLRTEFNERQGRLSPDGRWIAYTSDESGAAEVYVQGFPDREGSGPKIRVSVDGGSNPKWRGDGKELLYIARDQRLRAVDVKAASTFEVGTTRTLVEVSQDYTFTADGQRFLVSTAVGDSSSAAIVLLVNWTSALFR